VSNAKHTPEKWHVHPGSPSIVRDEQDSFIAEGCSNEHARLIAAAPDLLAALEKLLKSAATHHYSNLEGVIEARAAIAKAKGEA
jgi:hypothetical protein